ncbi:MAG TPA: DUF2125 domain-containing protein [Caulobacteraceae bacterium]|jgi:hypothetical protein
MPDASASPQPQSPTIPLKRPSRIWLFGPYLVLLVAVLLWSGFWMIEKWRLERELPKQAEALQKQGYVAQWSSLKVGGYPFRLRVTLIGPRLADSSGWGLAATRLEAQAMAYAPDTWVLAAPQGLIVSRPGAGEVSVSGKAIRASAAALGSAQPRLAFEGDALSLAAAQGATPPAFASIGRLELDLQPGPNDQAAFYVRLDDGVLTPGAGIARMASGKPFSLLWDARLTRLSMLRGSNWPGALQTWRNAGGSLSVANASIGIGGLTLKGQGGPLSVDPDGRLKGELPLKLDTGQGSNNALMGALGLLGPVPLRFQDGRASIGPIPVGAALKIG